MAKFCTNCGKEITEGVTFCTGCGTPTSAEEAKPAQEESKPKQESTVTQKQEIPAQTTYTAPPQQTNTAPPQPTYTAPPQPTYTAPPQPSYQAQTLPIAEKSNTVGTGYFFGMMFLYAIPVLGWLACLITAFVPKNPSKRNFAKAMIIWFIISIVFYVIGYFVFKGLFIQVLDYIKEEFGNQFGDFINTIG